MRRVCYATGRYYQVAVTSASTFHDVPEAGGEDEGSRSDGGDGANAIRGCRYMWLAA
jgi:hypothetical protein